ncbi:hypothetical protein [Halobacterium jilantaiense]|uniref:Uncharacterized protein n=1 Tax=Halobacterium jilantaiense TaxID=355548 RepID=A0A1I0R3I4_9EURY|nr:hypothetical protein [Halobacterium jilantaiense]SEW35025.1 hypothetical protein SAMN04487945_3117 [Halobacterium jilantaiense]
MSRKWTPEYLRNGFVDEVKQKRAEQGYNTNEKPTHKWLRENGFGYFLHRVRELDTRPDEWLLEECGFERRYKDYPCNNPETVRRVESWLEYVDNVGGRLNGRSIPSTRSHIRRSMEIAKEAIGTSDIFELGRGERTVCFNRAKQMMRAFKNEFETGQSRYNYVTTLRDLLAQMEDEDVIDHDPLTPLVEKIGWGGDSTPVTVAPSTSLVKAYFDACETRTEQMVMICLAVMGWRPSDFCDPEAIQDIHFDEVRPYVEFTTHRKNGPSLVPIILCQDFVKQWVRFVETVPGNDTALFPSDSSNDGARSTQWVRETIEAIGDRVDETLRNGEKPTPRHFRNFWYTEYTTAYAEFRRDNDFAASAQGSRSARIPSTSYNDPLHGSWFDTFEQFAHPKLSEPVADLEPADEIGNIDTGDIDGDATFDLVETARQATLEGWEEAKALVPGGGEVAYLTSHMAVAAGHTAATWGNIKHRGMAMHPDLEHYPNMSVRRQAGIGLVLGFLLTVLLASWHLDGTFTKLATGKLTAWVPVAFTVIYAAWLFDRELPGPHDAVKALR